MILCVVKNSTEVPSFPNGVFHNLMTITLKLNSGSKNKSLKLIALIIIKYLIKRGAAKESNFNDITSVSLDLFKMSYFDMRVSAAKTLSNLFKEALTFQVNVSTLKKNFKKISKQMTQWMTSELRRNYVNAYFRGFELLYWEEAKIHPHERKLTEENTQGFINTWIEQVSQILLVVDKTQYHMYALYNILEFLVLAIERTKQFIIGENIERILDILMNSASNLKSEQQYHGTRDAFSLFFERMISQIPNSACKKLYSIVFSKLTMSKHKINF